MEEDPKKFVFRTSGPKFDIESEEGTFLEWKEQWESFELCSGLGRLDTTGDGNAQRVKKLRKAALSEALSRSTLTVLRNLTVPDRDDADECIKALEEHVQGKINRHVRRHRLF